MKKSQIYVQNVRLSGPVLILCAILYILDKSVMSKRLPIPLELLWLIAAIIKEKKIPMIAILFGSTPNPSAFRSMAFVTFKQSSKAAGNRCSGAKR